MLAPLHTLGFLLTLFIMPTNPKDYQREYQRRYRKKEGNARRVVSVALSPEIYDEISAYAEVEGVALSPLMRDAALHQIRGSQIKSGEVADELRELKFLIANIANNVNQMAHHSNQLRQVMDESEVLRELKKLEDQVIEFTTNRMNST